jgi:predicted TIM-barrel fold metal-dependent hydrolase
MTGTAPPLAGDRPLIDVHAHFFYAGCGRAQWDALNRARFRAGEQMGIAFHIGSVLGSWGRHSPVYFASPNDSVRGNDEMLAVQRAAPSRVRSYVAVNPNDTAFALDEIDRCVSLGAVGVKLAAARRADDPLLDPIADRAAAGGLPVLHHIWQHRRRHWPTQDISDGADLAQLAARHPRVSFILAHIGGGGDYAHTFAAVADVPNIYLDLSGSGVDRGMLDGALSAVGPGRLVWGADITLETGLAKLWALEVIGLTSDELDDICWRTATRIFPRGSLPIQARESAMRDEQLDGRGSRLPPPDSR